MADVTVTASQVRILDAIEARTTSAFASVAITKGQACYITSTGLAALALATGVATGPTVGIATHDAAVGQPVTLLHYGRLAGFTLGNPGTVVYLSDENAGGVNATAPAANAEFVQPIGRVFEMTDGTGTEYLYVDISLSFVPEALVVG